MTMTTKKSDVSTEHARPVVIAPARIRTVVIPIVGTSPYVANNFSEEARTIMHSVQEAGSQSQKSRKKTAKNFEAGFKGSLHVSEEGWHGVPASAFRSGLISACRVAQFKMTIAKLSIFIQEDGLDKVDGMPLVQIFGTPEYVEHPVRNATGVIDLRARAMFRSWTMNVTVEFDEDQFSLDDVVNLMERLGKQVGIGAGRPDSKMSAGMGWGRFMVDRAAASDKAVA